MKVNLIQSTPLSIVVESLRTCWNSSTEEYNVQTNYIIDKDKEFLSRVIKKYKHQSGWEHCVYHLEISGVSRALLQEWSRHRIQSLSVRSTRYTLKELKNDNDIKLEKYCYVSDIQEINATNLDTLLKMKILLENNIPNDKVKYMLPESYLTQFRCTINARSLNNLLNLRTDKSALQEFRDLANMIYDSLPSEHKFLFDIYDKEL